MSEDTDSALRSITKGAGLVFLGTVLQLGIAFLAKVVMVRFLELNEYGFVSLGIIAINFGATVALLGLDTGVARYLPRYDREESRRTVAYFSYLVSLSLSVLVAVSLYVFAGTISRVVFENPSLTPVLRVMAVGIPFWTLLDLGVGITRGTSETLPRVYAKNVLLPLSRFALVSLAILLGMGGLGVASAYVGSYALASVFMTYLVFKRLSPVFPPFGTEQRNVLEFSIPLTFSNLSSLMYRNIDLVFLGVFWGAGQVAIYNVAYPFSRLLLVGTGAFGFLFVPVVSSFHAEDELNDAKRVYQVTTKWLLLMVSPPFAVMALFPEMSIKVLFGAKYVDGSLTLVVLAVGFFLTNATGLNGSVLTSIGRSKIVMLTDVTAMVLNVILNLLLIPEYSFLGAAIATSVTYVGRDFANGVVLYHLTEIHPFTTSMVRPAVFTAVAIAVIYVPVQLYLKVTLLRLVGLFVLFMFVYAAAILRLGGVDREDVMMLNAVEERSGIDLGPAKRLLVRLMG
ncbi:MAG: oligosaccharide flippase family protein [Halobacteriales archaeon]